MDYDTWDAAPGEDDRVKRHTAAGVFVPINILFDGVWRACARVGTIKEPARVSAHEADFVLLLQPEHVPPVPYRTKVVTFDRAGLTCVHRHASWHQSRSSR